MSFDPVEVGPLDPVEVEPLTAWWHELADSELRRRLTQRGMPGDLADLTVAQREMPVAMALITAELGED